MASENTELCAPFLSYGRFSIFRDISPDMDYIPAQSQSRRAKKRAKSRVVARKRLTVQDLPSELIMIVLDYMDPVTSTCFGLTCHQFYIVHFRLRGPTHLNVFTTPPPESPKTGTIILRNVLFKWFPKSKQYNYCKKRFIFVPKGKQAKKYRFRWGPIMRKTEDFKRVDERRKLARPLIAQLVNSQAHGYHSDSEDEGYYARCEIARQKREAEERLREKEKWDRWVKIEFERQGMLLAKEERTKCKGRKLKLRRKAEEIAAYIGLLGDEGLSFQ